MKKIKSKAMLVVGIFMVLAGFLLSWRSSEIQGSVRMLLVIEAIVFGLSIMISSFSWEAVNNDKKQPPDERSELIRLNAKARSFDIVTGIMLLFPSLFNLFYNGTDRLDQYITVTVYGMLAISWLIKAVLLIFYERNG